MITDQIVQSAIERREQQDASRRVSSQRADASMQRRRKRNRERGFEVPEQSGIQNLGRRGGHDYPVPIASFHEFLNLASDNVLFVRDLVERIAIKPQACEIELDAF